MLDESNAAHSKSISAEMVTDLCLQKFRTLPKTGKPTVGEWTVLSGVVMADKTYNNIKVVALGAGTKCIGREKLCHHGLIINDSHAEVLARRALLRYFYRKMHLATTDSQAGNPFVWKADKKVYALRKGVSFHFFSTQTPCGDACILHTCEDSDLNSTDATCLGLPAKRQRFTDDIVTSSLNSVYTGAKLIGDAHADPLQQVLGAVRQKPGRGDRTLSMSCSDKLSKWQLLGLQGALLDAVLEQPIYIETFNFCCHIKCESIERALYKRWANKKFKCVRFHTFQAPIRSCTTYTFEFQQNAELQPSPNGLAWCDIEGVLKPHEISVNGWRQGVTAKKMYTAQASLKISKYFLLQEFISLLKTNRMLLTKLNLSGTELEEISYCQYKNLASDYQLAWSKAKSAYFEQWTQKPIELSNFSTNKTKAKERS